MRKTLLHGLLAMAIFGLTSLAVSGQSATSTAAATPAVSPAPSTSPMPVPTSPTGYLEGNWRVERAIFELFGNLKEVTQNDERFYAFLNLGPAGKGTVQYGTKQTTIDIEYELKNSQNLTVAFGSRLKPQVDLYQMLMLADGSLYLRSVRLAGVNGTVYYLLRKVQS